MHSSINQCIVYSRSRQEYQHEAKQCAAVDGAATCVLATKKTQNQYQFKCGLSSAAPGSFDKNSSDITASVPEKGTSDSKIKR